MCHPHHVGFEHAGIMSIAGLITFSVVFNTGRFLEFETVYDNAVSIFAYIIMMQALFLTYSEN